MRTLPLVMVIMMVIVSGAVSATAHPDPCRATPRPYGNLVVTVFNTTCHSLTPHYWRDGGKGITRSKAEKLLRQKDITPLAIIPGGFNNNLPDNREPVDYVEIGDPANPIAYRAWPPRERWPIIFSSKRDTGESYLGIVKDIADLPKNRDWAIAAGLWLKVINNDPEFTVRVFGNDGMDTPWIEFVFRRTAKNGLRFIGERNKRPAPFWNDEQHGAQRRRLIYHWPQRRAIFLNQTGTMFPIVAGASGARDLAGLLVMLGYQDGILLDSGSATLPKTKNPVYLVVTKK